MTALDLYRSIDASSRATVRTAALRAAHPELSRLPAWVDSDCAREDNHPALVAALRAWWQTLPTDVIVARLDTADVRVRELAIVLCAESVAHLSDDPPVAECRRVRLAWVRGDASDKQRDEAQDAAWAAVRAAASVAARDAASAAARDAARAAARDAAWAAAGAAAWAAARDAARDAAWAAAYASLAAPLRTLYPDPCRLDWCDALSRWDTAVAEAQSAMRAIGGAT